MSSVSCKNPFKASDLCKPGGVQHAESYKGKCDHKTLGSWRAAKVSVHVGTLLSWCLSNCVSAPFLPAILHFICIALIFMTLCH